MANEILSSTPSKTPTIRDRGELNVERLAEELSGIINKTLTAESLEALLFDIGEAIGFRLRSVESESDDHEARLERLETAMKFVQPKAASKRQTESNHSEMDFEILSHIAEVKSTIEKRGLRNMDPDATDAIWRSVDSIQQLIDRGLEVGAAA